MGKFDLDSEPGKVDPHRLEALDLVGLAGHQAQEPEVVRLIAAYGEDSDSLNSVPLLAQSTVVGVLTACR